MVVHPQPDGLNRRWDFPVVAPPDLHSGMSRYDPTDFEWRVIAPLLPNKPRPNRSLLRADSGLRLLAQKTPHPAMLIQAEKCWVMYMKSFALNIETFTSVGPFRFNMTREEVRQIGGPDFKSFFRGAGQLVDRYEPAVFCYYDKTDHLEAIEMAFPAAPTYLGTELFKLNFESGVAFLRSFDPNIVIEIDGALALSLGISLYVPLGKEDAAAPIEGVLAFRKGYYD